MNSKLNAKKINLESYIKNRTNYMLNMYGKNIKAQLLSYHDDNIKIEIKGEVYLIEETGREDYINGNLKKEYAIRKEIDSGYYQFANAYAYSFKDLLSEEFNI